MTFHNHEENIKKAKEIICALNIVPRPLDRISLNQNQRLVLIGVLQSMIEDAETGHARIKQLEGQLNG